MRIFPGHRVHSRARACRTLFRGIAYKKRRVAYTKHTCDRFAAQLVDKVQCGADVDAGTSLRYQSGFDSEYPEYETMTKSKFTLWYFLGYVLLTGCLNNRYIAPVTTFRTSTTQTISTISSFYSSRNAYEINVYLAGIAADPTLEVGTKDNSGQLTPLGRPVFSADSIKARLDALSLVGTYLL